MVSLYLPIEIVEYILSFLVSKSPYCHYEDEHQYALVCYEWNQVMNSITTRQYKTISIPRSIVCDSENNSAKILMLFLNNFGSCTDEIIEIQSEFTIKYVNNGTQLQNVIIKANDLSFIYSQDLMISKAILSIEETTLNDINRRMSSYYNLKCPSNKQHWKRFDTENNANDANDFFDVKVFHRVINRRSYCASEFGIEQSLKTQQMVVIITFKFDSDIQIVCFSC